MSRKKLVYTVDDDCRPAVGPDGNLVNAVKEHARNLLSPAIPYFFNTVYDPCVSEHSKNNRSYCNTRPRRTGRIKTLQTLRCCFAGRALPPRHPLSASLQLPDQLTDRPTNQPTNQPTNKHTHTHTSYREGSDFVRGYPYSLRQGVATAVSHGLWLHNYDYDAPTQLLKVLLVLLVLLAVLALLYHVPLLWRLL